MKQIFHNRIYRISIISVLLIAIIWGLLILITNRKVGYTPYKVSRMDLVETVTATGNVSAEKEANLTYDIQGRISSIKVNVGDKVNAGDILASLDSGSMQAQLSSALADIKSAEARYEQTKRGSRPEELDIANQKYKDSTSLLITAIRNAYLATENAILGKSDQIFINGSTVVPRINIKTQSRNEEVDIQDRRVALGEKLKIWKNQIESINSTSGNYSTSTLLQIRNITADTLSYAKDFIDRLGFITNNLNTGDSGMTQASIDNIRSIVNSAGQYITNAVSTEQTADANWSNSRNALSLLNSGSTSEDIQIAEANLEKARAIASNYQVQYSNAFLIAPFDGIVSKIDMKIGEIFNPNSAGNSKISIISNTPNKIEIYVPEIKMAKINEGNIANVTLDAYGPELKFPAKVKTIDLSSSIVNNIKAYKVTLSFDNIDNRIKSGMTGNVTIITGNATGTLAIPTRAIINHDAKKYVLKKINKSYEENEINTGLISENGYVQVLSGLEDSDEIANFGKNIN